MSAEPPKGKSGVLPKLALLAGLIVLGLWARHSGWLDALSLETLRARQHELQDSVQSNPLLWFAGYFAAYVAITALSIPGATLLTLGAGGIFGLWVGLLLVSFASTLGATLAFLSARWILRDTLRQMWPDRLATLDEGIRKSGAFYLFTLRLVPAFPFFAINLGMGLTALSLRTFWWVSQVGMLAGTFVYVNAGTRLSEVRTLSGLASPALVGSFVALGLFPWAARWALNFWKQKVAFSKWTRPRSFDRNLVVLGAGSGGLVASYIAAAMRAKVTLVERHQMGGDCLNTGCVPSKALIHRSRLLAELRQANSFLTQNVDARVDFQKVKAQVRGAIDAVAPHDSVERYTKLGVEVLQGSARIKSPWEVDVQLATGEHKTITTRSIVVATGGSPRVPEMIGLDQVRWVTSNTIWDLDTLPARLLVLGGGPIGCELAQAFARLGSQVSLVDRNAHLLPREDIGAGELLEKRFAQEGIAVYLSAQVSEFQIHSGVSVAVTNTTNGAQNIEFDVVLFALGRTPNSHGFGLEEMGVELEPSGLIKVDGAQRTNIPNMYAVGDVASPMQFTHLAGHQAWTAAVNALIAPFKSFQTNMQAIPRVTFTTPEIACVGLNEKQAQVAKIPFEVTLYQFAELDRALAENETEGWIKVLTVPGKDRILGVEIVGGPAGELLAEFTLALRHGLGLKKILGTVHPYPSWSDANKLAAGRWMQAHQPQKLLPWAERFFAWRR